MDFRSVHDALTGAVLPDLIEYRDDAGQSWVVSSGHRFWLLYQEWLSEGNELAS